MSNVKKPEPVAITYVNGDGLPSFKQTIYGVCTLRQGDAVITTDQSEAYKDACVREALEQLAETAMSAPITMELMDDDGAKATAWHISAQIRALIPKQ